MTDTDNKEDLPSFLPDINVVTLVFSMDQSRVVPFFTNLLTGDPRLARDLVVKYSDPCKSSKSHCIDMSVTKKPLSRNINPYIVPQLYCDLAQDEMRHYLLIALSSDHLKKVLDRACINFRMLGGLSCMLNTGPLFYMRAYAGEYLYAVRFYLSPVDHMIHLLKRYAL